MMYVLLDDERFVAGWYATDVHDVIPVGCLEVSEEVWASANDNNFNFMSLDGTFSYIDRTPIDQVEKDARAIRDYFLEANVDPILTNHLRWDDLTAEKQSELTQYRADLLGVPQQAGFPTDITWPTEPT